MDFQTWIACILVVLISTAVVYFTSVFGIRERTYEEALEEKRKSLDLDSLGRVSKSKQKKDKKDKKKEKKQEKAEELVLVKSQEVVVIKEDTSTKQVSPSITASPTLSKQSSKPSLSTDTSKQKQLSLVANVAFKSVSSDPSRSKSLPAALVDKDKDGKGSKKKDKPLEKLEKGQEKLGVHKKKDLKLDSETVQQKANRVKREETNTSILPPQQVNVENKAATLSPLASSSSATKLSESEGDKEGSCLPKKAKKHKQQQSSVPVVTEVSSKSLLEQIASSSLSNEEIQLIINSLLNKHVDEMNQWQKKHDPVNILKENLHEKEQEIQIHLQNLEAARRRIKELRLELEQERSVHSVDKEKISQMQKEFGAIRNSLQQAHEQQRHDVKALQGKIKEMQSELQGRNVLLQNMQEENTRLNLALQQFEAQRGNLERLPHVQRELEQLRAERTQFERRQSALQQTNEELHRQVKQVDEQIKSLNNAKQSDEYSFQKRLKEMQDKMRQFEANKTSMLEDLKNKVNRCDQLEKEKKVYEDEINMLNKQSSEIIKQRDMLEKAVKNFHEVEKDNEVMRKELERVSAELNLALTELQREQAKVNELSTFQREIEKIRMEEKTKCEEIEAASKREIESIMLQQKQASSEINDKIKSDLKSAQEAKEDLEARLKVIEQEKEEYEKERVKLKQAMKQVMQSDTNEGDSLCHQLEAVVSELSVIRNEIQALVKIPDKDQEEREQVTNKETPIDVQTNHYQFNSKQLLEEVGKKMKVELNKVQDNYNQLKSENDKLSEKIGQLESEKLLLQQSMAPISTLKDQVHEMEAKLKELQSKLELEETEKKNLETKSDENKTLITTLHEELANKTNEMDQLISEVEKIDEITKELNQIREELDKEKKKSKDYKSQIVKMSSLVQFGQDALKAESNRVKELEELLNIKNGTVSSITNGSAESSSAQESQEEASTN